MKQFKLYILSSLALIALLVSSCEEDSRVFDVDGGQTLLTFGSTVADFPVELNTTGLLTVQVNSTTRSSSDRTYNLSVDTEKTGLDASAYTVPASVTIPAGEFVGTFTIQADHSVLTTTKTDLVINLDGGDAIVEGSFTARVFLSCPLEADFTGEYRIEVLTPGVFGASTYGAENIVLEAGPTATSRVFNAAYFEDSRFVREFRLEFSCNEIIVPYQDHAVGCSGNDVNLSTGPAQGENGTYDPADDSSFIVNLTDNVDSDCDGLTGGGTPIQASYRFVKVQ